VGGVTLNSSSIHSEAASTGFGGFVDVTVSGALALTDSSISTNARSTGDAGGVFVTAGSILMRQASAISSDALSPLGGLSGLVSIETGLLDMAEGSTVSTGSANTGPAGDVFITADRLAMTGAGTEISSENSSDDPGDAGTISIATNAATIAEGARIGTNSRSGAAGDIDIEMSPASILILEGKTLPGVIETSSGPGTGGIITIASPLAIIINGGTISALGEAGGANVRIDTRYFIPSSDRRNVVEVNGTLTFSNAIYDVSSGTTDADLSILDASGVLHGQCSSMRASGNVSQLNIKPSGPYGAGIWSDIFSGGSVATTPGGCG
jgi:hypothetical protein